MRPKYMFAALAGVTALAGAAQAAEVTIKDAAARVVVIPENRADVVVEITPGSADLPTLQVRRSGNDVVIDGDLRRRIRGCENTGAGAGDLISPTEPPADATVEIRGIGDVRVADLPLVTLRTPMATEIKAGGAVFGAIGRTTSVDLDTAGCGDWTVANSNGEMSLSVAGSGDVRAGTSGRLEVSIAGSGDVHAGATRAVEASIAGSGGVDVARVDGPVEAAIAGSGDVTIRGGEASRLEASIAGSGDVDFAGTAGSLEASIIGSGDVRVGAVTGSVQRSVMGSGEVRVGR